MPYVDGYVVPVPKAKLAAYKKLAKGAAKVFKKHGALSVTECVADDVKPGKLTSFPQAVRLKKNEVVVFSWITFKNRAARDRCWKLAMKDPFMANYDPKKMPFDGKRMFWGGFKTLVSL
ncbi:MAG: DUF1428 domain-containing protein [Aestuariivirga sp.]